MKDKTETIKLESGATYVVSWDDGCVRLEGGITHLEPKLLPLLLDYAWRNKIRELLDRVDKEVVGEERNDWTNGKSARNELRSKQRATLKKIRKSI
jgi:hypothetical protein